jgi:hypothetical protein
MKRITILSLVVALLVVSAGAALAQEKECTLDAAFAKDVTVPDNTVFEPGEEFEKVWRLKNTGDCEWNEDYALAFIDGDQLEAPDFQPLEASVAAGETVDIAVQMTAPQEDGVYTSHWQMIDDEDNLFGDEIYVKIVVGTPPAEGAPTPAAGETPPPISVPISGVGEVVELDDGTPVYVFLYTPDASPGSPEFQEQKRQAVSAAAKEFVTLEPRPALMIVVPLDEAGEAIEADRVFIMGDDVPAFASMDVSAIGAPETGKAILFLENWIGEVSQVEVDSQSVEVPGKQGETPGRAFVSLDPGHYVVKGRVRGAEGTIEIDLNTGWIFVWALAIEGY